MNSLQKRREGCQILVPNIDGTIGQKIKTRKHRRHRMQGIIQYPTNRNPSQSLPENAITIFGPGLYNSLPKYRRDIKSLKTEKIQIWAQQSSRAHSWWAKNAQPCHRIRKQQHPRSAHSSEGSRNLPKWWSPRLGHRAVLAASKPLQVSKYPHFSLNFWLLALLHAFNTNTLNFHQYFKDKLFSHQPSSHMHNTWHRTSSYFNNLW